MNPIIETKNLYKLYEGTVPTIALNGINVSIESQSISAIIGQSGSGKSTLLNLLGTLDTPTDGQIIVDKQDVSLFTKDQLTEFRNKTIGFVFQFHYLLPEFNVLENVLLPYRIGNSWISNPTQKAKQLLELVGLEEQINKSSTDISGGQKQRVAIARALMNNPKIILADEPTGNLDSETSSKILDLFETINKVQKTTFILITHDDRVANRADKIIELKDGKILRTTFKKS